MNLTDPDPSDIVPSCPAAAILSEVPHDGARDAAEHLRDIVRDAVEDIVFHKQE